MALPLLPPEHIRPTFHHIKPSTSTSPIDSLLAYMQNTWITGRTWTPLDWSVYGVAVRTNNDVEGWHTRLNHRARKGRYLYDFHHFVI